MVQTSYNLIAPCMSYACIDHDMHTHFCYMHVQRTFNCSYIVLILQTHEKTQITHAYNTRVHTHTPTHTHTHTHMHTVPDKQHINM